MIRRFVERVLKRNGFRLARTSTGFSRQELAVMRQVAGLTATSPERVVAVLDAVRYVTTNQIPGAIVECGVWRGGSIMAAMIGLIEAGDTTREIYLYDTFEGMPPPSEEDVMFNGTKAEALLRKEAKQEDVGNCWCYASLATVQKHVMRTGYPETKTHFIKGKVEDTLPTTAPDKIALLRLDTDWYESTKHELEHLYPRLVDKGVLIIDDYGHWNGARRAVDEYFSSQSYRPLLTRLDYTGRMMVKPHG